MTALLITLAVLAGVNGYLAAGLVLAGRPYVTREIERKCRQFPSLNTPADLDNWRRTAAGEALFVTAIWPVALMFRAATSWLATSAPLSTHELRRQVAERDRHIADLERELGIGRRG